MDSEGRDSVDHGREPAERERREWREQRELSSRPGDGTLSRAEANRDATIRQWDVVTPGATTIGRPERPDADLDDSLRRLHDEQHPAMAGHAERMHRLDKARISHALCNALNLTPWERDRVVGIVTDLELTAFGSQRGISTVTLVVIRHIVDTERRRQLGLDDAERIAELTPDEMASLYELFTSITDEVTYQNLLEIHDLDTTSVNRLERVLKTQLEEQGLEDAVFGRSPHRDPNLESVVAADRADRQSSLERKGQNTGRPNGES